MNRHSVAAVGRLVEATAVLVCLYQALRVLFSVLFGLMYEALFAGTSGMAGVGLSLLAVILALCAPLVGPRRAGAGSATLLTTAIAVLAARIPLTLDVPLLRLLSSLVILAAAGLYLATLLRSAPHLATRALLLALVVDQLLRAAGQTFDVTLRPGWWPFQVGVSLALGLVSGHLLARQGPGSLKATGGEEVVGAWPGWLGGVGWGAWLFLQTSLLAFPNALARWTGSAYALAAPLLLAVTALPLSLKATGVEAGRWTTGWGFAARIGAAVALVGGLAGGALVGGVPGLASLLLAQLAAVVLLPAALLAGRDGRRESVGRAGLKATGLAVGGMLFLVLSFAHAFTFTYAYTLDLFRGLGLPLFLLAGLLAALPAVLRQPRANGRPPALPWPWAVGLALAAVILVAAWSWPRALRPSAAEGHPLGAPLRVATYNIHYGYNSDWRLSLAAQAEAIEAAAADVVALQEVDTGRATSYMVDDALWLARRLGMEAVYLPCVEGLTGIALLSRYPVVDTEGLLLPSKLEQTGIIWALLDVGGRQVNAFATWMGLEPEERACQLDAALPFIAAHPGPAIYGGDFNSTPDSPVYARVAAAGFVDPFVSLGLGSPPTDPAVNPDQRIDFVWLRELTPVAAQVSDSLASDHRLVVVEIERLR